MLSRRNDPAPHCSTKHGFVSCCQFVDASSICYRTKEKPRYRVRKHCLSQYERENLGLLRSRVAVGDTGNE